jgi:uncharacterized protein (TIGR03083 family)
MHTATDTWEMVDAERAEMADLADSLAPDDWDKPSLCTAWKVRDVVAHTVEGANESKGKTVAKVVRSGFRVDTMLRESALKGGAAPTDELRSEARAAIGKRKTPPFVTPEALLADEVVHQQDIRRVLGRPRQIPEDRLRVALTSVSGNGASYLPGKKRLRGLHLRATDLDWEAGDADGEEVQGTGEALLLALAGRPAALDDLTGPGVATLRERITT